MFAHQRCATVVIIYWNMMKYAFAMVAGNGFGTRMTQSVCVVTLELARILILQMAVCCASGIIFILIKLCRWVSISLNLKMQF
jgi:hypothetical protein